MVCIATTTYIQIYTWACPNTYQVLCILYNNYILQDGIGFDKCILLSVYHLQYVVCVSDLLSLCQIIGKYL